MRELKTTLRNGFRQEREPPLQHLVNQIRGQFPTSSNQLFYQNLKMEFRNHFKNGAESEKLTSRES